MSGAIIPVLPTLAAGAATVVAWYSVSRYLQRKKYPPGPYPWPVIGNLGYIMDDKKKMWVTLTELQKQYGDIYTIFIAGEPTVILGNLELIREALISKQNDFAGRPTTFSFDVFSRGGKDIVGGQFGPVWKRQRKIVHAAMRQFASGEVLANLIYEGTRKTFTHMDLEADTGKAFNPQHCLNMIIYNIICSMVFGQTYEHDDPFFTDFIKKNDDANDAFGSGLLADLFPIFKHVPTKGARLLHTVMDALSGLIEGTYAEHEKEFDENNMRDLVDHMLHSKKQAEANEGAEATEGLTYEHYVLAILDIFSAGTDTSRFTLMWAVLYMTCYPEVQKKLQLEIDSVADREEPLRIEHRAQLPYTEAFLHEVMRIKPLVPLALPHVTTCDTSVGGYTIPKGTQIFPNVWAVHMNPDNWENPEAFKPERFLDDSGKMGPRISSWLPFSTGRRVCVGEAVAKTELHLTIASLVQRYEFSAPPGVDLKPDWKGSGQLMMSEDYEVVLTRRK